MKTIERSADEDAQIAARIQKIEEEAKIAEKARSFTTMEEESNFAKEAFARNANKYLEEVEDAATVLKPKTESPFKGYNTPSIKPNPLPAPITIEKPLIQSSSRFITRYSGALSRSEVKVIKTIPSFKNLVLISSFEYAKGLSAGLTRTEAAKRAELITLNAAEQSVYPIVKLNESSKLNLSQEVKSTVAYATVIAVRTTTETIKREDTNTKTSLLTNTNTEVKVKTFPKTYTELKEYAEEQTLASPAIKNESSLKEREEVGTRSINETSSEVKTKINEQTKTRDKNITEKEQIENNREDGSKFESDKINKKREIILEGSELDSAKYSEYKIGTMILKQGMYYKAVAPPFTKLVNLKDRPYGVPKLKEGEVFVIGGTAPTDTKIDLGVVDLEIKDGKVTYYGHGEETNFSGEGDTAGLSVSNVPRGTPTLTESMLSSGNERPINSSKRRQVRIVSPNRYRQSREEYLNMMNEKTGRNLRWNRE
jgi:hypothetical protein